MSNPVDAQAGNQAFLQAAMNWQRGLLQSRAAAALPTEDKPRHFWQRKPAPAQPPSLAPSAQTARATMVEAAAANPASPFARLAKNFGLSPFEQDLLLLAVAAELDSGMPALLAAAQGDASKRYATFALGMSLFEEPSWDALSPECPLRAQRLLEVHQSGAGSLLAAPLRIDERIAAYIKGLNYLDERLAALATPLPSLEALPPSQEAVATALARWLSSETTRGLVQLSGSHPGAKLDVVARAAALSGRQAYAVQADVLPVRADELEIFERLWSREARLMPLVLLIQGVEGVEPLAGEDGKSPSRPRWPRALARIAAPCFIDVRKPLPDLDTTTSLSVAPPTALERSALWAHALTLGDQAPHDADVARLGAEFETSASQLEALAGQARFLAAVDGDAAVTLAWQSCVQHAGATLAGLTHWLDPRATIDDLQLPAADKAQLERLIEHARQRSTVASEFGFDQRGARGLGIAALFHGESGTGKTVAAEAVANALSLGLAMIDLATVKSKYIGETEKNLRRIFDAAEQGGAVLFFDEADALFGKRSEVKDSHDRYANIEVNYLLTRMENFSGVAVLATNQKHALDPAFLRRLRFVIGFPFPGPSERKAIWQSVFPKQTPVGKLDFDRLARFQLSGGGIFNVALSAAHSAAAAGSRVEMAQVLDAVRWELRKQDRPVSEAEFRDLPGNGAGPQRPRTEARA